MARPDYFCRFIPARWRTSTLSLGLEEEGLLIRISAYNMDCGKPLPADRTTVCRMLGGINRNKFDKVFKKLLAAKEVVEDATGIYSPRALAEYHRATAEIDRKADAKGKKTAGASKSRQAHAHELPLGNLGATPPVDPKNSSQNQSRSADKMRGVGVDSSTPTNNQYRPESVSQADRPARVDFDLSGSDREILVTVEPSFECPRTAERWLVGEIEVKGRDSVRDAHAMLVRKRQCGQQIKLPHAWISKTASTLAAQRRSSAAAAVPKAAPPAAGVDLAKVAPAERAALLAEAERRYYAANPSALKFVEAKLAEGARAS